jgi:recombination protein RecT
MSRKEVEKIRDNSRGYQAAKRFKKESVWDSDFTAMGLKTVIRRLCKFLPKSPELATALALDAAAESGKAQNLDVKEVVEGTYAPIIDADTGEILDADPKQTEAKPDPEQEVKTEQAKVEKTEISGVKATAVKHDDTLTIVIDPREQGSRATKPNTKLTAAIKAMEKATTNEALDETYIRLEPDFEGIDLEVLMREYRRIKADIDSLI